MAVEERRLLIEGWRGVNHSFALINQHQILALRRLAGMRVFHRDLPFAFPHWNTAENDAGFDDDDRASLDAPREPDPDLDVIDGVYRICSPFRTGADSLHPTSRTTTFMITELGLSPASFCAGADRSAFFTQGRNRIVTSTAWSRERIVEYGFDGDRVHTAPLGVDTAIFQPAWPDARARSRAALGIAADETVFLNIGAPLWNKGTDILLKVFALLRLNGLGVRLMVKDQQGIYGVRLDTMIQSVGREFPPLLQDAVLSGITTIPMNLSPRQLCALYGAADCYVSPYRAEGFNLPVLEAIACAVPTIVTRGGATDDFCDDATSWRVEGRFGRRSDGAGLVGAYIEPQADCLYEAMAAVARGWRPDRGRFDTARQAVLRRYTWQRAAEATARLALD